ncbi:proline-specific permease [Tothia fuscella]|uniref:Proline-specific permease n=1 Tax=Tothia fuscella TaxID=1048955 RepID=A0A9P4U3F6_9PEZI|nr:proline-specific permease [Tothia fuscella]
MMAFTACIGFGLFLQSGKVIYIAGPGLGCIAFVLACTMMWSVIAALGEMTALFPVQGPLFEFPGRFLDEAVGYACGWMAWFAWTVTIAAELVAVAQLWTFNFDEDYLREVGYPDKTLAWSTRNNSAAVWVFIFLIIIGVVNLLPVQIYGQLEYLFGCIKLTFITGLIVFNVILSALQLVPHGGDHFWTWNAPYAFASKGITVRTGDHGPSSDTMIVGQIGQLAALWTAITTVVWSLVGFESIAMTAMENRDLEKWETTKIASKKLFMRITFLYTLSTFTASLNVPRDDRNLRNIQANSIHAGQNSIFVLAAVRNHLRGWPSFFNGFFIFSAMSSGINALYLSSRLLHALASIPEAWPLWAQSFRRRLERTSSRGVPLATVATSWCFGLLAFLAVKGFPSIILGRITQNATVSFVIVYGVVCASYIVFYHHIKIAAEDHTLESREAYSRDDPRYPYRTHGQLFRSWYGFIFCTLLVLFNGWRSFISPFSTPDFIVSYIGIVVFFLLVAAYHVKMDGWNPLSWKRHASLQIQRPPPKVVVPGRRRGILHLPNEKRVFTVKNSKAFADWVWVWLK